MAKSPQKPTPRQIAFFMFMGVDDVEEMTKEEVGEILTTGFADWWFDRYGREPELARWFYERSSEWSLQRIILYPELYSSERKTFLEHTVVDEVGTYVRGQFTGSSERITRAKLIEVADLMLLDDPDWWCKLDRKRAFLARFQIVFPHCCDGRKPERAASPVSTTSAVNRVMVTVPQISSVIPPLKPYASIGEIANPLTPANKVLPRRMNQRIVVVTCVAILLVLALFLLS